MANRVKGDWLLYLVWVIVFVLVVVFTITHDLESTSFFGITETREIVISSENSVEIKNIFVVEGQSITQGQKLVELNSPDLTIKINQISHQLEELKAQKGVDKNELISKINQLKAEKQAIISETTNKIKQLENQFKINKALTSELKSISGYDNSEESTTSNPIFLEIESLKQELTLKTSPLDIQIELSQAMLDASESPIKIQVERLEKELDLLHQEQDKLVIYAQISGIIGSVNYKAGEQVAHHNPILTLHTKNPSLIKGYIFEDVYTKIDVGMEVNITSMTDARSKIQGTVIGVGSRIVEYPVRLRKHPDVQLWGREIMIKIPEVNNLILGEKVLINIPDGNTSNQAHAKTLGSRDAQSDETTPSILNHELCDNCQIVVVKPLDSQNIEASALTYLPDLDRYIVLSDDMPNNRPLILLMDSKGNITSENSLSGLTSIDDMESIAQGDNGDLYIATSQSINAKGRLNSNRFLLVKVKVEVKDNAFTITGKANLREALENAAANSKQDDWANFLLKGMTDGALDIEGLEFAEDNLYLGVKSPLLDGQSVILKIKQIDDIFTTSALSSEQISIWKTVRLAEDGTSIPERLSGLYFADDEMYMTGVNETETSSAKSGSVWRYDVTSGEVVRLAHFNNLKPEGIAKSHIEGSLAICFDQGRKHPSRVAYLGVKY